MNHPEPIAELVTKNIQISSAEEPLKTLEAPPSHEETEERQGASLTTWQESDQSQLPMIVWLRGDEPWFPSFDLDADSVMQRLGIKRSRLTQISGRELRVGRVRIDRYIKPIYRSEDVDTYLQWTRATASHQKSSSVIKEAVEQLQAQSNHISQIVREASGHFVKALEDGLMTQLEGAATRSTDQLAQTIQDLYAGTIQFVESSHIEQKETNNARHQEVTGRHNEITANLQQINERLALHDACIETLTLRMSDTATRLGSLVTLAEKQNAQIEVLAQAVEQQQRLLARLVHEGDWWQKRRAGAKQKLSQPPLAPAKSSGPSTAIHRPNRRRVK